MSILLKCHKKFYQPRPFYFLIARFKRFRVNSENVELEEVKSKEKRTKIETKTGKVEKYKQKKLKKQKQELKPKKILELRTWIFKLNYVQNKQRKLIISEEKIARNKI